MSLCPDTTTLSIPSSALSFDLNKAFAAIQTPPPQTTASLPSPPASDVSIDFDSFTADLAISPLSSAPSSNASSLVSPRSSVGTINNAFSFEHINSTSNTALVAAPDKSSAIEALSAHHLERFLHYKALAAQAEADYSISLFDGNLMPVDDHRNNMLSLQSQPAQQFFGVAHPGTQPNGNMWNQPFAYHHQQQQQQHHQQQQQQQQQQVFHAQAQAQAHLQAHEAAQAHAAAAAAAQQQRSMSMTSYYMPTSARSSFDNIQPMWSRQSGGTSVSGASPPFPSTPTYSAPTMAPPIIKGSNPSFTTLPSSMHMSTSIEGENELDEDDELDYVSAGEREDMKGLSGIPIPNLHGGGRGYIPGKTPDDPKKRHKCQVCGRGFARAFNLKSHVQTHDPLRPKPHMCPHPSCKRGFSRLHDLERHRQGIHSDGPLVDAKRQGVSPSVVRAQTRIQRRAESGGLI